MGTSTRRDQLAASGCHAAQLGKRPTLYLVFTLYSMQNDGYDSTVQYSPIHLLLIASSVLGCYHVQYRQFARR
jgi:hypothetical protein